MASVFENAQFGSLFKTRDGGNAVYLAYIPFSNLHKLFVQGCELPLLYHPDGRRRGGGGRYVNKYGADLDIIGRT